MNDSTRIGSRCRSFGLQSIHSPSFRSLVLLFLTFLVGADAFGQETAADPVEFDSSLIEVAPEGSDETVPSDEEPITSSMVIVGGVVDSSTPQDDTPLILPYFRSNEGDEGECTDVLMWCGGGLEPPFIYYTMLGGNLFPRSFAISAQTGNQFEVASRLDSLNGITTPEIQAVIDNISLLSPHQQRAAFDSLSGESFGTLSGVGLQIGEQSLRVIANRLINNFAFMSSGSGMQLGQGGGSATNLMNVSMVRGQSPVYGPSGWMQGYGSQGNWNANGNAAGADYRMGGFAYGVDISHDESGVIGIAGSHGYTNLGTERGDFGGVTSHQVALYLLKSFSSFYGLGVVNYGHNGNQLTRRVTDGFDQQLVSSAFSSNQFGAYGEAGMNLDFEAARIQPFFGLQCLSLTSSNALEGPLGGVGLFIPKHTDNTFQTHLGARAILMTLSTESGIEFRPYLSARWVAELAGTNGATTAAFAGDPAGASWTVVGNHLGRHTGQTGLGFTARLADGISLYGNYDLQFGEKFYSQVGSGGMLFEF